MDEDVHATNPNKYARRSASVAFGRGENRAEWIPGLPARASTSRPESSARVTKPEARAKRWALREHFPHKYCHFLPHLSAIPYVSGVVRVIFIPSRRDCISINFPGFPVATNNRCILLLRMSFAKLTVRTKPTHHMWALTSQYYLTRGNKICYNNSSKS